MFLTGKLLQLQAGRRSQRSEAKNLPLLATAKWHEHDTSGAWDDPAADLVVAIVTATAGVEVTDAETPNALYRALMTPRHSNESNDPPAQ